MSIKAVSVFLAATLLSVSAHAYVGPGLGAGLLATVLGILGSIFLLIVGVIYYPIKRFLKQKRKAKKELDLP